MNNRAVYDAALRDFEGARKQARIQQLTARLRGNSSELLAWHDVCEVCQIMPYDSDEGAREIPIKAIVGSVGRYNDFTRDFLPRKDNNRERWTGVRMSLNQMRGWPPIDVYQVGEVYFVIDGNHRVSVSRQFGGETISARVTEVALDIPITADDDPNTIISRAQYGTFAAVTHLDTVLPDADLRLTFHSQYKFLLDSICAYAQVNNLSNELGAEAIHGWYADVYTPILDVIRANNECQQAFPNRTEADMYVLLTKHQADLETETGWHVDPVVAAADLDTSKRSFWQRIKQIITPNAFVDGPQPGQWRSRREPLRQQLFRDVLVVLDDTPSDVHLLKEAIRFSTKKEKNRLYGVVAVDSVDSTEKDEGMIGRVRDRFEQLTTEAGLETQFAIEYGSVGDILIRRAHWADLVMTNLTGPFRDTPIKPGMQRFIQQSPTPIHVIREGVSNDAEHALLGYDGSLKSKEALYMAVWLCGRWEIPLTVVTIETDWTPAAVLDDAQHYIEQRGLTADYILKKRPITPAILDVAQTAGCDLIIIGGYGFTPLRQTVTSSTVDQLIKQSNIPMLICR